MAGTSIIWANVAAALVSRVGVRPLIAAGMALLSVGMLLFTQIGVGDSYVTALLPGLPDRRAGYGALLRADLDRRARRVRQEEAGLASGLFNTSQQIGGAVGIALLSSIAVSTTETSSASGIAVPDALVSGFQAAFWVGAAIAAVGFVADAGAGARLRAGAGRRHRAGAGACTRRGLTGVQKRRWCGSPAPPPFGTC